MVMITNRDVATAIVDGLCKRTARRKLQNTRRLVMQSIENNKTTRADDA